MNFNALGAKPIVKQYNQPLAANDIRAGQWVVVTYDGTNMQMQSQSGNGAVASVFGRSPVTRGQRHLIFNQIAETAEASQLPGCGDADRPREHGPGGDSGLQRGVPRAADEVRAAGESAGSMHAE